MPTQAEWDTFLTGYRTTIQGLRDDLKAYKTAVRTNLTELQDAVAALQAGGTGGVSEDRVKEIVRELVAD